MVKYNLKYRHSTQYEMDGIYLYIAADNRERALAFRKEVEQSILNLADFPYMGAKDEESGLYRLIKKPYIIFYDVNEEDNTVEVLHIRHSARKQYKKAKSKN